MGPHPGSVLVIPGCRPHEDNLSSPSLRLLVCEGQMQMLLDAGLYTRHLVRLR